MLDDRYELQRVIGSGGSADVYQATDTTLGREVAVKMLRAHSASDTDRLRFVSEARTLAALDHPRLMTVLDAGADGDQLYLVLTLIEGRSLSQRRGEEVPLTRVAAIGAQVADALAYAHDQGVVHRDVKPGNVLVDDEGHAWLGDFGISRMIGEAVRHTETGSLIGTAAYLAPEQVRGTELTPATDIYSLGLVLLELITGEVSYPGPPVEAALARLANGPEIPDHVPVDWQRLLRRMTALEPADRFPAAECAAALHALAEGLEPAMSPLATVPVPVTQPVSQPVSPPVSPPVPVPATSPATETVAVPVTGPEVDEGPATELIAVPDSANGVAPPDRTRQRWLLAAVGVIVAALISTGVVLNGGEADPDRAATDPVPTGVAPIVRDPLQDLHDAVTSSLAEALPTLPAILDRLDQALVNRAYKRAGVQVSELVTTVEFAVENDVVDEADAGAVLAAATALKAAFPKAPTATPTPTPTPTAPVASGGGGGGDGKPGKGGKKGGGKKKGGGR